jgi:type II secretory pathway pseudopilin PulG
MDACWALQLPPTEKAVLISLADQANDAGVCWPSVASLCERTCLGQRTVQRALRALEQAGLLACAVGAMKSNRYTLAVAQLRQLSQAREVEREASRERQRQADAAERDGESAVTTPATVAPRQCGTPASVAPHPRHTGTQTVIEPNTNTPHTPQPSAGGLAGAAAQCSGTAPAAPAPPSRPKAQREGKPALGLVAWLEQVKAAGEDAIPANDPVHAYAAKVGIGEDLLRLCWREFKRRHLESGKRQKDWRQKFRNCVQGSWYQLWWLAPGEAARLSSKGEQALRFFEAEDAADAAGGA